MFERKEGRKKNVEKKRIENKQKKEQGDKKNFQKQTNTQAYTSTTGQYHYYHNPTP